MKKLLLMTLSLSLQVHAVVPDLVGQELVQDLSLMDMDSVIEEDTRNQVMSHTDPVSKAVGLLSYGGGFCTATLISSRHILTNGHCVTKGNGRGGLALRNPRDLQFTAGKLNATDAGAGVYTGIRIDTFMQWVTNGNPEYDVAVIKLDRPVPGVAPLRLQRNNRASGFEDFMLTINGYSSKKPYGTQWIGTGSFEGLTGTQSFFHNIDTLPGTSGAIIRRKFGNIWLGIGVHRGSVTSRGVTLNRAILFSDTVFNSIAQWLKN